MQLAQWDITSGCNLRCQHCRAWRLPRTNELSLGEGLDLLKELEALGIKYLTLSGGEPFIHQDIFELLEFAGKRFNEIVITTNATLLDEKEVKALTKYSKIKLSIGLDGLAEAHDKFRGVPGTFDKVKNILGLTTKYKLPTLIRYSLSTKNYQDAEGLIDFVSSYRVQRLNARALIPVGRAKEDPSLFLSKKKYINTIKKMMNRTKEVGLRFVCSDPVFNPLFPELLKSSYGGEFDIDDLEAGCFAGSELIYIQSNGNVTPCSYIPLNIGNVRDQPLAIILKNSSLIQVLKNYRKHLKGKCAECKFLNLCGGCRARALALKGDILEEDPGCLLPLQNLIR